MSNETECQALLHRRAALKQSPPACSAGLLYTARTHPWPLPSCTLDRNRYTQHAAQVILGKVWHALAPFLIQRMGEPARRLTANLFRAVARCSTPLRAMLRETVRPFVATDRRRAGLVRRLHL